MRRLDDAQIANAQVNTLQQFWRHPQLAARERWREIGSPVGPLPALLPPGQWDDGEGPRMGPVPTLGEHTDALLAELGYDADAIAALRAARAI
jgi:crotonobetainyl-CoA:carnitine CoA-transferase CaiB-like acyl-CoA transferase